MASNSAQTHASSNRFNKVTLVALAPASLDRVESDLGSSCRLRHLTSLEPLLTATRLGTLSADVVVLGEEVAEPVRVAQQIHDLDRNVQLVIVASHSSVLVLKRKADYTPTIGDEVVIVDADDPGDIAVAVKRAVKKAHRRVGFRRESGDSVPSAEDEPGTRTQVFSFLDTVLENAPIGMLTIDDEGRILTLNRRAREMLSVEQQTLLETPVSRFFSEFDRKRLKNLILDPPEPNRRHAPAVFDIRRESGDVRHYEVTLAPLPQSGRSKSKLMLLHDVTGHIRAGREKRRVQRDLERMRRRLRETADNADWVPFEMNPATQAADYVGPSVTGLLDVDPGELTSKDGWMGRVHPDDRERVLAERTKHISESNDYSLKYRVQSRTGEYIDVEEAGSIARDEAGLAVHATGFLRRVAGAGTVPDVESG